MVASVKNVRSPLSKEANPQELKSNHNIDEINFHQLSLHDDIGQCSLKEAYSHFVLDLQGDIPLIIWLLENPQSVFALPGKVDLYGHDCIHLLLNRGKSNFDEAFVIGFTMGNCTELKDHHLKIFRMFATKLYPSKFRFNRYHMKSFELGLAYGESLETKNINQINFDMYSESKVQTLRESLGINLEELKNVCYAERLWVQLEALGQ